MPLGYYGVVLTDVTEELFEDGGLDNEGTHRTGTYVVKVRLNFDVLSFYQSLAEGSESAIQGSKSCAPNALVGTIKLNASQPRFNSRIMPLILLSRLPPRGLRTLVGADQCS